MTNKKIVKYILKGNYHYKDCAFINSDTGVCNCPSKRILKKQFEEQNKNWLYRFRKNFRYENWNGEQKLKRRIIRKGVETWISATGKQVESFIEKEINRAIKELKNELE